MEELRYESLGQRFRVGNRQRRDDLHKEMVGKVRVDVRRGALLAEIEFVTVEALEALARDARATLAALDSRVEHQLPAGVQRAGERNGARG